MNRLLWSRIVLIPTIFFIFLISLIFSFRGIWLSVEVMIEFITGKHKFHTFSELSDVEPPVLKLLESVDSFLLAFVFFIFSFGLYKIFFIPDDHNLNSKLPRWLQIDTLFELKALLWQSILTTILVIFLNYSVTVLSQNAMSWNFLMIPLSILILSIALYFLKLSEKESNRTT
jgi:uncharacterized membrane protein YqhA